jgi:hypothetical protein
MGSRRKRGALLLYGKDKKDVLRNSFIQSD